MARKTVSNMFWDTKREKEIDRILESRSCNKSGLIQRNIKQNRLNRTYPKEKTYHDYFGRSTQDKES